MKNCKSLFLLLILFFTRGVFASYMNYEQEDKLLILSYASERCEELCSGLTNYGVDYQIVHGIDKSKNNLYIIPNIRDYSLDELPENYIVLQDDLIFEGEIDDNYISKLKNSIAVWDRFWNNINKYKTQVPNYYYFPRNYAYIDPVILPCLLPVSNLREYKEVLSKSNLFDNDVSSHLPTIYVHTVLNKPKLIFELGVASGQTSYAFNKAAMATSSKLVGVDIDPRWKSSYKNFSKNQCQFYGMDDIKFLKFFLKNPLYPNKKVNLIYIDTSHVYQHTLVELEHFIPILAESGSFCVHDTNMSPLEDFGWYCLTNKVCYKGWDNKKGVVRAIKEFFDIDFDETKYNMFSFSKFGRNWKLVHYPYCNGFTLIRHIDL